MIADYMRQRDLKTIIVTLVVPVRIMDFGGWTDTWFAEHGNVLNLSVFSRDASKAKGPYYGIEAVATVTLSKGPGSFTLHAPDVGKSLVCLTDKETLSKQDLIEATMISARWPEGVDVVLVVKSRIVPPGASVGSSSAVSVVSTALIDYFIRMEIDPSWVARSCHEVETKVMRIECGVQDQAACAHAFGASFIDIYQYPNLSISPVVLAQSTTSELEDRALTIIYGGCHSSSDVHKVVIEKLKKSGRLDSALERFRVIPAEARYCLLSGDFVGLGRAMRANTVAQRNLHEDLISFECQTLIELCRTNGTLGEKVNGAGGPQGGSLSVLCGDTPKEKLVKIIKNQFPDLLILEHRLADGGLRPSIKH